VDRDSTGVNQTALLLEQPLALQVLVIRVRFPAPSFCIGKR